MSKERENRFRAIRSSFKIRVALEKAWQIAMWNYAEVAEDAMKQKRIGITAATLSRYINSFDIETGMLKEGIENNLTEENILWLCTRWGVDVKLKVEAAPKILNHDNLIKKAQEFDPNDIHT